MPSVNWLQIAIEGGRKYIAAGYRGVLTHIRGDWEFHCQHFNFPKWNEAIRMCWICKASSTISELLFTKCGLDAGWRHTRVTHEDYLNDLRASGAAIPILFALIVGLRLECVMIDVLHCVDQGVASHVIGNIFWELVCAHKWGKPTQEANVAELMKQMHALYAPQETSSKVQGKLTVERIRSTNGWPKLKAKAAATRHLAEFALALAIEHDDGTPHSRMRVGVAQCLVDFYKMLKAEGMFLSDDAKKRLPKLGRTLCTLYSKLCSEAFGQGTKFWKMSPKHHLFQHLCEDQALAYGNPAFYWTYADEDLVGLLIEVAHSCHPSTMATVGLFKWRILGFDPDVAA